MQRVSPSTYLFSWTASSPATLRCPQLTGLTTAIFTSFYRPSGTSPSVKGISTRDRWGLFSSGVTGDGMWACCCSAFVLKFPHGESVSSLPALPGRFTVHTASCTASGWAERQSLTESKCARVYVCNMCVFGFHICTWLLLIIVINAKFCTMTKSGSHLTFSYLWENSVLEEKIAGKTG